MALDWNREALPLFQLVITNSGSDKRMLKGGSAIVDDRRPLASSKSGIDIDSTSYVKPQNFQRQGNKEQSTTVDLDFDLKIWIFLSLLWISLDFEKRPFRLAPNIKYLAMWGDNFHLSLLLLIECRDVGQYLPFAFNVRSIYAFLTSPIPHFGHRSLERLSQHNFGGIIISCQRIRRKGPL